MAAAGTRSPDPAQDVLRYSPPDLRTFLEPRSVAVIGATEKPNSVGRAILGHLLAGPLRDHVYPVNPEREQVLGARAYPTVDEVPGMLDLAVVATPAPTVPALVRACGARGVRGAIIISAGFRERGSEGVVLEEQVLAEARRGNVRLLGPNCLGVMRPSTGFNATYINIPAVAGSIGFVSQSGALGSAILDWSVRERVGFSAFFSVGSMLDIGWGDLIDYLGDDPQTESIVIYMETVGDARGFVSAAREVALAKPIIVLKAGRTAGGANAAASHTGALVGSDDVLHAALRRCGVLRVDTVADLFYLAEALSKQPRPRGPRLTIVTNAGGPGVLAADELLRCGGTLPTLSQEAVQALDVDLPPYWSRGNPIDIGGDAGPERYRRAVDVAVAEPGSDGTLVIFAPLGLTDPTTIAAELKNMGRARRGPLLASWMGGPGVAAAQDLLNEFNIPTFAYPDTAARVFHHMWRYNYNLHGLYETPMPLDAAAADRRQVAASITAARQAGRVLLSEAESKAVLEAYGLPVVRTSVADSPELAVELAEAIGYPVVLKLQSTTISHKRQVGGVELNLQDAAAVGRAFAAIRAAAEQAGGAPAFAGVSVQPMIEVVGPELIVGSSADAQFGPVLLFGAGGRLVELIADHALGLPPLNTTLARRLIERTRVARLIGGEQGWGTAVLEDLERLLVRFSQLVLEQPAIRSIEINPLVLSKGALLALDARVVPHPADVADDALPRPAIRPYPSQYVTGATIKDGTPITVRPIRAEDEPPMVRFHQTLSENSVYMRYFQILKLDQRIAHERLTRICFVDYDREMALVAVRQGPDASSEEILGVSRLSRRRGYPEAEFALLISDRWQGQGLGSLLLRRLVEIGRAEGLRRIVADILPENRPMQLVARKIGFTTRYDAQEGVVKAVLELAP